ncbi:MFS transporter [Blochmannia endosymbiont of Colobopsis nipponica]|uniref:MFS transporter n=1 Tax=Blochmannia endosymbiont of Colobopsis nipponica TaxID=2681987 RepID=UPI00177D4AAE|nr:MFS transporter [Blochmannia endosymbiont of Colobopsis nipponica]QOI11186.1 MFS transporter [Blochmannia endosymbiont of Colobopsis nipponica]
MKFHQISIIEIKSILGLSLIFSLRIFGIFIILPTLSTFGMMLNGANEFLIGLAIGIYGVTQAIFQIPWGIASDKIGRKPIIISNLIIFSVGSIIAAATNNIWNVIIGRAIQGIGGVSSPVMALLCDLTQKQNRTKAMSFLGAIIGIVFAISLILGPYLAHKIGINGLFWIVTIIALLNILFTLFFICHLEKNCGVNTNSYIVTKNSIKKILYNKELIKINVNAFFLHTILILNFISLPIQIISMGILNKNQWKIYLIIMIISFMVVIPFLLHIEKKQHTQKNIYILLLITIIFFSEILLLNTTTQIYKLLFGMQLFFIGFSIMEAILPSMLSKISPCGYQGTSMGIYSTIQFLGMACGSLSGGYLLVTLQNNQLIFLAGSILSILWLLIILLINQKTYKKQPKENNQISQPS